MKKLPKEKISKKIIDIDSEILGNAVGQKKEKNKSKDLTQEIEIFLETPMTIDNIKYIILRLSGRNFIEKCQKSKMCIYQIESTFPNEIDFFIILTSERDFKKKYFLSQHHLMELTYFGQKEKLSNSLLRASVARKIYNWISVNKKFVQFLR